MMVSKEKPDLLNNINYYFVISLLISFLLALSVPFHDGVIDPFHEGEYLTLLNNLPYLSGSSFPVLIHGAMDFIPAMFAKLFFQQAEIIHGVRLTNFIFGVAVFCLWLAITNQIIAKQKNKLFWFTCSITFFIWGTLYGGLSSPREFQLGAVIGLRDFAILLFLYTLIRHIKSENRAYLSYALIGISGTLSLIWSYDRGIIMMAFLAGYSLHMLLDKKLKSALLILTSISIFSLLTLWIDIAGSIVDHIRNILYWVQFSGEIWAVKTSILEWPIQLKLLAIIIGIMLFSLIISARNIITKTTDPFLYLRSGLLMAQLVLVVKLIQLPPFGTLQFFFMWPSLLLLLSSISFIAPSLIGKVNHLLYILCTFKSKYTSSIILAILVIIIGLNSSPVVYIKKAVNNIVFFTTPKTNEYYVSSEHYGTSEIDSDITGCVFQWTNEGIFSAVLDKPFCTKYPYAVYIASSKETEALQELKENPPGLIIYDSPFWSMSIYGRHMKDRLPLIHNFILSNYSFIKGGEGYLFGYLKPDKQSNK